MSADFEFIIQIHSDTDIIHTQKCSYCMQKIRTVNFSLQIFDCNPRHGSGHSSETQDSLSKSNVRMLCGLICARIFQPYSFAFNGESIKSVW